VLVLYGCRELWNEILKLRSRIVASPVAVFTVLDARAIEVASNALQRRLGMVVPGDVDHEGSLGAAV
jgi:hypothetical protein